MASTAAKSNIGDTFSSLKAPLGNNEISIEMDNEICQLTIEVANASRFVVHRRIISKPEEVRYITGDL